jgi:hypothetical protein
VAGRLSQAQHSLRSNQVDGLLRLPPARQRIKAKQRPVPIAILFRYSLNHFDPQLMLVDTFTLENYI